MTANGKGLTFAYNSENMLTSVGGGRFAGAALSWDPLNRISRTNGFGGFNFVHDGARSVIEYHDDGSVRLRNVFGRGRPPALTGTAPFAMGLPSC